MEEERPRIMEGLRGAVADRLRVRWCRKITLLEDGNTWIKEVEELRRENAELRAVNSRQEIEISELRKALQSVVARQVELEKKLEQKERKSRRVETSKKLARPPPPTTVRQNSHLKRKKPSTDHADLKISAPKKRRVKIELVEGESSEWEQEERTSKSSLLRVEEPKRKRKKVEAPSEEIQSDLMQKMKDVVNKICDREESDWSEEMDFSVPSLSAASPSPEGSSYDESPYRSEERGTSFSDAIKIGEDDRDTESREKVVYKSKPPVCKHYAAGRYCKFGDDCRFSHEGSSGEKLRGKPIRHRYLSPDRPRSGRSSYRSNRTEKGPHSREPSNGYRSSNSGARIWFAGLPMHTTSKSLLGALRKKLDVARIRLGNRVEITNGRSIVCFQDEDVARKLLNSLPFKVFNVNVEVHEERVSHNQDSAGDGTHVFLSGLPLKTTSKNLMGALRKHLNMHRLPIRNRVNPINGFSEIWFEDAETANNLLNSLPFKVFDRVVDVSRSPWRERGNSRKNEYWGQDLRDLPDIRDLQVNRHNRRYL